MQQHALFMHRCLELAQSGRKRVGNGALVGALLVREEKIVAEAFYTGYGQHHAEKLLIEKFYGALDKEKKFDQKNRSNDVLYVNLEPCVPHPTKKTPGCSPTIISSPIGHVVVGMLDPDPRVAGQGVTELRKAGIKVTCPLIPAECSRLNRGFLSVRTKTRPWITIKSARRMDGRISNVDRTPLKITSNEQDLWSHKHLRATHDAILVGVGTIMSDDPLLTIRNVDTHEQPYRIVLDPTLRIPRTAKVVNDQHRDRTIVVTSDAKDLDEKSQLLASEGVRVVRLPLFGGNFVWDRFFEALCTPQGGYYGITSVLVEGGERTWDIFRSAGFVDEEVHLVAF